MTYFVGNYPPDEMLKIYDAKHGIGDAEKKAWAAKLAKATDGDVYLSKRSAPGDRYLVNVDGEMKTVSHALKDGHWKVWADNEETNLVIKIRTGTSIWSVYQTIERTLYETKLGRALGYGSDAIREMSRAVCEVLGLEDYDEYAVDHDVATIDTDQMARVRNALIALLKTAPEGSYWPEMGEMGAKADGVGYARDAEKYDELLNGVSNGFDEPFEKRKNPLPLLSEPVYYAVMGGKGDGRTFRARLEDLKKTVGLDEEDER